MPAKPSLSLQDIQEQAAAAGVEVIQLQFTDIFGTLKHISITLDHLPTVVDQGIVFDGSSIEGFARVQESDMYLRPDLSTFAVLPWRTPDGDGIARLLCDVVTPFGEPFAGCPRAVLKRAVAEAAAAGYVLQAGPEPEFFLFPVGSDGAIRYKTQDTAGYFDLAPVDQGENARNAIVKGLRTMGYHVEASHHEVAPGQHEIDFRFADALQAADNLVTFKQVTKAIAHSHGLHASFIPKPLTGEAGSGMHIHLSLLKDGLPAFQSNGDSTELSQTGLHFLGGLLYHARAMTAVTNSTVNSYKRLIAGYEAPIDITWSDRNRSALVRIPATVVKDDVRMEYRSPDPAANPYLTLALLLRAGLEGIAQKRDPGPATKEDTYTFTPSQRQDQGISLLPESLKEALDQMVQSPFVLDTLGDHVYEHFVRAKLLEWDIYRAQVHPWELDQYLATL